MIAHERRSTGLSARPGVDDEHAGSRRLGSQARNAGPACAISFTAQEVPYGIALVRILITFTLLFVMVPRWYFARELFSTDGAPISLWDAYSTHPWVPNPTGAVAVAVASVVILTPADVDAWDGARGFRSSWRPAAMCI